MNWMFTKLDALQNYCKVRHRLCIACICIFPWVHVLGVLFVILYHNSILPFFFFAISLCIVPDYMYQFYFIVLVISTYYIMVGDIYLYTYWRIRVYLPVHLAAIASKDSYSNSCGLDCVHRSTCNNWLLPTVGQKLLISG